MILNSLIKFEYICIKYQEYSSMSVVLESKDLMIAENECKIVLKI